MQTLYDLVTGRSRLVVAHRGASSLAPENTLAALRLALQAGAEMVEVDVQITTDGRIVVIHDTTLERTTNGHGVVARHSFAQLRQLDAGTWFGEAFRNERIPLLTEVFELLRGRACIDVEIKPPARDEDWRQRVNLITAATAAAGMTPYTLFSSFHHDSLRYIHSLQQGFHTAALLPPGDERLASQLLRDTGCQGFVCALDQLTPARAADLAEHGIFAGVYTINTEAEVELAIAGNARAIVTDAPERITGYLRSREK
jgi:glycerophosphoryl diester phosphodiesterase